MAIAALLIAPALLVFMLLRRLWRPRARPDGSVLRLAIARTQTAQRMFYAGEQAMDLPRAPNVAATLQTPR